MKTCLVCELARSKPSPIVFGDAHRERFRETLQPPSGTVIWLGAFSGAPDLFFTSDHPEFHGSIEGGPVTRLSQGFSGTLTVGKLLAQVLWLGDGFPATTNCSLTVRGDWTRQTVKIWPTSARQTYGPPEPLDDGRLAKFAERWMIGKGVSRSGSV